MRILINPINSTRVVTLLVTFNQETIPMEWVNTKLDILRISKQAIHLTNVVQRMLAICQAKTYL